MVEAHRPTVFENRSLRKISGPKLYKVTGGLIKVHKDRLHNLYSLPNIIMVVKTRRKNLAGHVTWMGYRPAYRLWLGNLKEKHYLEENT
jgi:hypothetical protein